MKNPEYYDRRIRQYQKKHGISNAEPNPTMSSKLKLKRHIESYPGDDEVKPPKRRKVGAERVKSVSVSGMIRLPVDSDPV